MAARGGPEWLARFAEFAAQRHCVARACLMVGAIGRITAGDAPCHPQSVLERSRRPGRSAGPLARALEEFLVGEGLAFGLDQEARLARGRRQRRVQGVPASLRPAVAAFADHLVRSGERARRAGTRPRKDSTIEANLGIVRDLARFVATERSEQDWSLVAVGDLEAFLASRPSNRKRCLQAARQFFRWARKAKLVLVDPTKGLSSTPRGGFTGETLALAEQRRLFRRWTGGEAHPHEALVGLLALLHAVSSTEVRHLKVDDFDEARCTLRVGRRPAPVPLDPVSASAVRRCLAQRASLGTHNQHILVTRQTKTRDGPASAPYVCHVLDGAGTSPKRLRSTRVVELVSVLGPRVAGDALGMQPEGLVYYLADHVDAGRLPLEE